MYIINRLNSPYVRLDSLLIKFNRNGVYKTTDKKVADKLKKLGFEVTTNKGKA